MIQKENEEKIFLLRDQVGCPSLSRRIGGQ